MTLPLSKEQIEAIRARAEDAHTYLFKVMEFHKHARTDIPALCQQALRAIELEAERGCEREQHEARLTASGNTIRELQTELTAARNALENILRCDDEAKQAAGIEGATLNGYGLVDLFDVLDHPFGVGPHKQSAYRSNDLNNALSMARAALPSPQVKG